MTKPTDPFLAFVELAAGALAAQQRATEAQRQRATLEELSRLRRETDRRTNDAEARRARRKARELAGRVEWRAATLGEALRHARGRVLLFGTHDEGWTWIELRDWSSIPEQRAAVVASESDEFELVRWLVPAS